MTSDDRCLMRTPRCAPLESPLHYILRLSEANGYWTPAVVIELATHGEASRVTTRWDYSNLGPVLPKCRCLPASFGYRWLARDSKADLSLMGKHVHSRHVNAGGAGICPQCIQLLGYAPAWWDLRYANACPEHHRMFVRACPSCGKPITHLRRGLLTCACGASLDVESAVMPTPDLLWLMALLRDKVEAPSSRPIQEGRQRPLRPEEVSLAVLCRIIETVLKAEARMCDPTGRGRRKWLGYLPSVASFLCDWPHGVRTFCSRWRKYVQANDAGRFGIQSEFAWAFQSLFKNLGEHRSETLFVPDAVLRYEIATRGGAAIDIRSDDLRAIPRNEGTYCSLATAARLSGIPIHTLLRMVWKGAIPYRIHHRHKRRRYEIETAVARTLKLDHHPAMDHRRASAYLGITHALYRELRVFEVLKKRRPTTIPTALAIRDLDEFRESVLARAVQPNSDADLTSLDALRRRKYPRRAMVQVVQRMLDGTTPCYLPEAPSSKLDALRVPAKDAAAILADYCPPKPTIKQFETRYHLSDSEVRALAAHLASSRSDVQRGVPPAWLDQSKFDAFTRRFGGVTAYARKQRIRYKAAIAQLARADVELLDLAVPGRCFSAHFVPNR